MQLMQKEEEIFKHYLEILSCHFIIDMHIVNQLKNYQFITCIHVPVELNVAIFD